MSPSSFARVLAPLAAFALLSLMGPTHATADPPGTPAPVQGWTAEWSATTSVNPRMFFTDTDSPVCHWRTGGFVGNAVPTYRPGTNEVTAWACGGKSHPNDFAFLLGDKGYKLVAYNKSSDWQPAHTLLDHGKGLCVANIRGQKLAGTLTRGEGNKCIVAIWGQDVVVEDFSFIVASHDNLPHDNGWWDAWDPTSNPDIPFTALPLRAGSYLCKASHAGVEWFGSTFYGTPPNMSQGPYCKITHRKGTKATEIYVPGYNEVFLNNKPSKTGALYLSTLGSPEPLPNGMGMCWRPFSNTNEIGVRKLSGQSRGCVFPTGSGTGLMNYLQRR